MKSSTADVLERLHAAAREPDPRHERASRTQLRLPRGALSAAASTAVALLIGPGALLLIHHRTAQPTTPTGAHQAIARTTPTTHTLGTTHDPINTVPTLSQLLAHFAVLRRPQTSSDRSWGSVSESVSPFQVLLPRLTRLARTLHDGDRVFLTVERIGRTPQINQAPGTTR